MSGQRIYLADCLDSAQPPEKVLAASVIGDTVFLSINEYRENGEQVVVNQGPDIAVSLPSLREALVLLANDRDRENLRPLDPPGNDRGERAATLTGRRHGVVPL